MLSASESLKKKENNERVGLCRVEQGVYCWVGSCIDTASLFVYSVGLGLSKLLLISRRNC